MMTLLNCKIRVFQGRLILYLRSFQRPRALRFSALPLTLSAAAEDGCWRCNLGFLSSASHRAVSSFSRDLSVHHSKEDLGSHSDWPSLRYLFMDQGLATRVAGEEDADWLSLSEA